MRTLFGGSAASAEHAVPTTPIAATSAKPLHLLIIMSLPRGLLRPQAFCVQNGYGLGLSLIVTHCQLVNSSQLAGPPMRVPLPDAPVPPNGICGSSATVWSLMWSRAVRSRLPSASARPTDFENTPADRPYSLLLASSTASSSVAKLGIDATGPNPSPSKARMPGFTPESTVGRYTAPSKVPPALSFAPAATV